MLAVSELCQDIILCPAWSLLATLFVTTPRSAPAIDWAGDHVQGVDWHHGNNQQPVSANSALIDAAFSSNINMSMK